MRLATRNLKIAALALAFLPGLATAESAREILDRAAAVNRARRPADMTLTLAVRDSHAGRTLTTREVETRVKYYADDAAKTVAYMLAPFDLKGAAHLVWSRPGEPELRWLYLPALKRIRQLGPVDRGEGLEGSVFSAGDFDLLRRITVWTEEEAEARLLGSSEKVGEVDCAALEITPKGADTPYGRFRVWIARADSTLRKIELYAKEDGELVKRGVFGDFRDVDGVPVPHTADLVNPRSSLRSEVTVSDVALDQGLDEEIFTPGHLARVNR